jgi:WD40 repeat protein/predicted Ser/Thr protein kinase
VGGLCPQCVLSLALLQSPAPADPNDEPVTIAHAVAGRILGDRYQIRELLGRGGMGEVFRAFDLKLRVDVALKAVHADHRQSERAREMLRREVRSAREVISPNVCRIFDLIVEEGQEFVSMEYVDGETLAHVLKARGPLPLAEVREIASQFLAGLESIHRAGLVHRDLKPENVMVTRAGRVVVMDFGLASVATATATATIAGTPAYMAPEQLRGDALDARTDVFAAAIVLAEMLSVAADDFSASRQALCRAVRETPPRVPDGPWAPVLRRALAADPDTRHGSAHALARALDEVTERLPGFEAKHPYPGLGSFTEQDAEYFFGREVEIEGVWQKLKRPRLLALTGPSGAGKTSFLRAGLLPTLPDGWQAVVATPGTRPFQSLAQALAPSLADDAQAFAALLRFEEEDTAVSLFTRLRQRHAHALVIVDQFEELFTLNDARVQAAFARLLARLVLEADVHVIVSLRDDFLVRCHAHEPLAPALSDLVFLGTLGESALRRALVQPALACGYRFEDDALADEIVSDVNRERGALPLLAFAASRLWETRDRERGLLTRAAYRRIGGVAGALAQHAESTLERIGAGRIPIVRELFRNLVTSQGTRAVRERSDLLSVFHEAGEAAAASGAEDVLNALVDARLLTAYERPGDGGSRQEVEIIHESLLSHWPRLERWQTQDADGAQLRDQLRQAAQLWRDRGSSEDLLWSGQAYLDFSLWRQRYPGALSDTEEAFARAMQTRATRSRRRRRAAVGTLVVLTASVALITSVLWRRADLSRRQAESEALRAEASKVLLLGERELDTNPTAALAYAIKGLELADTDVGRLLALRVLQRAPVARLVASVRAESMRNAFSRTGEWAAIGGLNSVTLLERESGRMRRLVEYTSRGAAAAVVAFSPTRDEVMASFRGDIRRWSVADGRELGRTRIEDSSDDLTLKSGFFTETTVGQRRIIREWSFDTADSRELGSMDAATGTVDRAFRGEWLAYAVGRKVYVRSLKFWQVPPRLVAKHSADIRGLGLSADGKRLAATDGSGEMHVWALNTGTAASALSAQVPGSWWPIFDTTGRRLAVHGFVDGRPTVRLFDLDAPPGSEPAMLTRSDTASIYEDSFDPTGRWLVTSHGKDTAFWWLGDDRPTILPVPERDGWISSLAFTPDSRWLLSVGADGPVRAWPLAARDHPRVLLPDGYVHSAIAVDPSGRSVAVGLNRGRLTLIGLDGAPSRVLSGFSERTVVKSLAFGDGGRLLAAGPGISPRDEKVVRIYDLQTGSVSVVGPLPGGGEGRAGRILSLAFVDATHLLASVEHTGVVSVDLQKGTSRVVAAEPNAAFAVSPGRSVGAGLQIASADTHGQPTGPTPVVCFRPDGTIVRRLPSYGAATVVATNRSGTLVATGSVDGTVRIGSITGGEPYIFLGHRSSVAALAFSPDGRWLASSASDRTVRLWPVPDQSKPPLHRRPIAELLRVLRSHTNLRVVGDASEPSGYRLEIGPFPGWGRPPED